MTGSHPVAPTPGAGKGPAQPFHRRILDFPLVALLAGLVAVNAPLVALAILVRNLPLGDAPTSLVMSVVLIAATLLAVLAYKLVVTRIGTQTRDDLPFDIRAADFLRGSLAAALLMSLIVGVVALLGGYTIAGWGGSSSLATILLGAGLQAAFVEEIVARGIVFRFLEEFGGSWFALALSSAIFGLAHYGNANATVFSSLAIALEAGLMLGGAYMLTSNLWLAIGLHFGWNVTQGYVWDVPVSGMAVDGLVASRTHGSELVSGGAFGVEASVVALVLATAFGLWLVVLAARKGQVVRPWWVRRRLAQAEEAVAAD
ncbi:CPBP family intramembrane metalloprotease [Tsuneonella sp. YG55]|uniref:CPBP family intramembrane metalloprotease n=1 Tax=Tsuneonella litorea TaxID=2976475 RepID=A0A9X2W1S9_9SPHN|nr:type II CAAX endopeptidase family protein [Tsuneonella litorea]MCT2558355.1 CPBP family intramembrane metalloprotease [Tsuneonella litorea]